MEAKYTLAALVGIAAVAVVVASAGQSSAAGSGDARWLNATLVDVTTNETYSIGSFDKPVLVETFAVWCTSCTRQQQEVKRLHELRHDFVSVSLNTDPNEDAAYVRQHARRNGFDWRYSVPPPAVVESLVQEFGSSITVAPQAPMILVCPDGSRQRLPNGVKPASQLSDRLDEAC